MNGQEPTSYATIDCIWGRSGGHLHRRCDQAFGDGCTGSTGQYDPCNLSQSLSVNMHHTDHFPFKVGVSMLHREREYKKRGEHRVAKFMPHFNGPYSIMKTLPSHSTVMIKLPNSPNTFPTFHTSQVLLFVENDKDLLLQCSTLQSPTLS